ncbi:hypothetical protein [Flavisericum labens]|uniref:hypothetical protein n=1 Tax=Flavisericum labens TaxID=3377112 RepID=UPI00387AAE77
MNLVKNVLAFLKRDPNDNKLKSPKGFCPNCWGRQEYGGNFYKALKTANIKDLEYKKGWITLYVESNLKGIYLQTKVNKLVCNVCFKSYNTCR